LHPKVEEWLSEFDSEETKRAYQHNIELFFQATGLTAENLQAMSPDEIKHILLKWKADLLSKGKPQNTALHYLTSVRSFCVQINKPIKFRKGQLGKIEADTDSHVFSNGDLKTLFDIGDVTEKAILATACSLGWEISGFLELDRDKVRRQIEHAKANNANFVFFQDIRNKTGEARLAILNPLAIKWIDKYLETTKPNQPVIKKDETKEHYQKREDEFLRLFNYTQDGIQKMLNALAVKSGLKTTGPIRFHNIRKWLMSRLSRCGFNEFQIKYILGKSIGISDSTYLQTLQTEVEEKYPRVYEDYLNIVPELHTSKEELAKLNNLKSEFDVTKAQFADMLVNHQKKNDELESKLEKVTEKLEFLEKYINLNDSVQTQSDEERLLDFLEKMRYEKYVKERVEQSKESS
jgi:site-specific recombinase XerD